MLYGQISGVGKPVSRLVQGCVRFSPETQDQDFELLDAILATGCNTFDTAGCYGNGDSERTLGKWANDRGVREQVVISTKGAHPTADRQRVTTFDITTDLHDSLARLKTSYIDIFFLHRDNPEVPVGPIVEVLNAHLRAGLVRAFGASNWTHERIHEANEYARTRHLVPFAVSSPNLCLAERVKEPWGTCVSIGGPKGEAARRWYESERIPLFSWSSLAAGFFSGRFRPDNLDSFTHFLDRVVVDAYCYEQNFRRLERAAELARAKGCTVPQVALAFVLSQPMDVYALLGCQTSEEFRENLAALEIRLTPQEIEWLDLRQDKR